MATQSSRKPYYAVVAFKRTKGGIAVDSSMPASGERSALRLAERMTSSGKAGALVFSRTGDPEFGEFDEPVELGRFGEVPEDIWEMMAA